MDTTPNPQDQEPPREPRTAAPLLGEPLPVELMNTVWAGHQGVHDSLLDARDLAAWLRAVASRLPPGADDVQAVDGEHAAHGVQAMDQVRVRNRVHAAERVHAADGEHVAGGTRAPTRSDAPEVAAGIPAADQPSGLVAEFRQLRDALRRLAAAVTEDDRAAARTGEPDVAAAIEAVNRACAHAPSWSRLSWPEGGAPARATRSSHAPAATALSAIAEQAAQLFAGPDRTELRACHAPGCVLYFLRTHPRREWCSPACGNRARVARHYQRHHGRPAH
jgi:predicted RNA-binding Zn ribbon-like protein